MSKSITAGIDFGNQTCVLSIPTRYGVDIILNQSSNRKTPTMVGYQDERRFSGEFALQQQMMNINNTITHLKQLVGLPYNSDEREEISKCAPYKIICLDDNGLSGIQLENGTILRPEQIIAYLFKSLLEIIQIKNPKIEQLVITIPPWWNELQKRTILNAASISKIKIASLIDSTTSAAVSYVKIHSDRFSNKPKDKSNVVFIDIGDTSMNVAVTSLSKKSIEIKGSAFDKTISGQFFTKQLEDFLLKKVQDKYKIDPKTNKRTIIRFQQATEKVKKALSANSIIMFEVPSLMNDIDVSIPVKRDEFNEIIQSHIEKVVKTIEKALKNSNLNKEDVDAIEVIGGGSRIPAIKTQIKEFFGCEPMMSLDLDECFAIGAGYLAAKADGYDIGIDTISCVYPFDIDAEYEEQKENKIQKINVIKSGTQIPYNATFSLPVLNKSTISLVSNNDKIGSIEISTGCEEEVEADITVSFDSFGLINVNKTSFKKKKDKEYKEKDEIKDEVKENNEEKDKVKEGNDAKDEIKEDNGAKDEIKEGNDAKDEVKEGNGAKDEIKEGNDANDEINIAGKVEGNLNGSFIYLPFTVISSDCISEYAKIEEEMENKDKKEIEIDNIKNDLESFIFTTLNDLNSVTINDEEEKNEITDIKEKVNEVFSWFSENEFERLELDEYKAKISEIKVEIDRLNQHKKYHESMNKLNELKQKLTTDLEIVQNDTERISLKESLDLQAEIPKQISKIDEISKSTKKDVCEFDINTFEKNVDIIDTKAKSLKNIIINESKEETKENEQDMQEEANHSSESAIAKEETDSNTKQEAIHNIEINEATEKLLTDEKEEANHSSDPSIAIEETNENPKQESIQNTEINEATEKISDVKEEKKEIREVSNQNPKTESSSDYFEEAKESSEKNINLNKEKSRIKIKKSKNFSNKELLIKLDPLKKNRPSSNNQKYRIKLPPLLPIEDEDTDLLLESQMKSFDTINSKSPSLLQSSNQQNEVKPILKEKVSNLPPLEKSKQDESFDSIKSFKFPRLPTQQRRVGPSFRFNAA